MPINFGLLLVCVTGALVIGGMFISAVETAGPVLTVLFCGFLAYLHFSSPKK